MKYSLKEYVQYQYNEHLGELYIFADESYVISTNASQYIEILKDLKQNGLDVNSDKWLHHDFFKFLKEENLLSIKYDRNSTKLGIMNRTLRYFELFTSDPVKTMEVLKNKHVLVLGIGGTGSIILQHLISSGLGKVSVVDYSTVDFPDLNRQFIFNQSSVGKLKTDEFCCYVKRISPSIIVHSYNIKITNLESLIPLNNQGYDLVINACDTPWNLHDILNNFILINRYPFYDSGVGLTNGEFGPLIIPGKTLCIKCFNDALYQNLPKEHQKIRKMKLHPPKASIGPTNSIISSFAALEILNYLCHFNEKTIAIQHYLDFSNYSFSSFETSKVCDCWSRYD